MTARLASIADIAYRRRGRMVIAWILAMFVAFGLSGALKGKFEANYSTPGSESKAASDLIEHKFGGFSGSQVDVVWKTAGPATAPAVKRRIDAFLADASKVNGVGKPQPIRVAPGGHIAATGLQLTKQPWDFEKSDGQDLIALANKAGGNGLELKLGGDVIQNAESNNGPEGQGLIGAAIVLLIAFGSVVAAGLPLAIAIFGLGLSIPLIGLLAAVINVPDWSTAISGLIGIGVGVDYALLVLTRFRSALDDGKEPHDAVVEAVSTAGRSVLIAGSTVVIAMLGLFFVGVSYMYGVALAASLAVLIVMAASITLLPALLGFAGRKVDRLRIPFLGRRRQLHDAGESPASRWAHLVQRHPWFAAIAAAAVLLALAAPALGMRLGFPDAGNSRPDTMTRQSYDLISEGFGPGANGPLLVAVQLPASGAKQQLAAFATKAKADPDVAFVAPAQTNPSGDTAIVTVIPRSGPQSAESSDLVHRLRDDIVPSTLGNTGIHAEVGGSTAGLEDQSNYIQSRLPVFIGGIVALSFLLLLFAFHSPLISLKAGIMNLLSIGAAYGVMTLASNGGGFANLIGIDHEVPIAPFMPVMMFAILFGLSMDYEVFLISRIREEFVKDRNTTRAVADGLAKTARVITAAAAIMIVVFLAFLLADDVFLKLLGIGMATAILVDATIVRMVLVPAVMQLLGPRNWWIPAWLERALPTLDVERAAPAGQTS